MEKIRIRIERTYRFVKGKGCDECELNDLCNEVEWSNCNEGQDGHYEVDEEELEQIK